MLDKDDAENDNENGVIYSNNITEVEDNKYKLYIESKINNNNNYDINKIGNNYKSELELSSITKINSEYNNTIQEEKLDADDNDNDNDKLNIPIIIKEKEEQKNIENKIPLLYGNDINNLYPKYLGKMLSFIYIKNEPLITVGPDCKYFNI